VVRADRLAGKRRLQSNNRSSTAFPAPGWPSEWAMATLRRHAGLIIDLRSNATVGGSPDVNFYLPSTFPRSGQAEPVIVSRSSAHAGYRNLQSQDFPNSATRFYYAASPWYVADQSLQVLRREARGLRMQLLSGSGGGRSHGRRQYPGGICRWRRASICFLRRTATSMP